MKKTIPFILLSFFALTGCAKKKSIHCIQLALSNRPALKSTIKSLDKIGVGESNQANFSGKMMGRDSSAVEEKVFPLIYATIALIDQASNEAIGTTTDLNGNFTLAVPPSKYNLKIQYVGYNAIVANDLVFRRGDKIELNAELGQGTNKSDSTIYQVESNWQFSTWTSKTK